MHVYMKFTTGIVVTVDISFSAVQHSRKLVKHVSAGIQLNVIKVTTVQDLHGHGHEGGHRCLYIKASHQERKEKNTETHQLQTRSTDAGLSPWAQSVVPNLVGGHTCQVGLCWCGDWGHFQNFTCCQPLTH